VLTPRPRVGAGWDDLSADERRMHARQQEVFAGFLTHTDAQIGRVLSSSRPGTLGGHAGHGLLRQRGQRRGGQAWQRQRAPVHRPPARVRGRQPGRLRRLGRFQHLQPLLVGLGLGRQHAAQALEALHLARRHPHAADRALARPDRRPGPCAPSSPTWSTSMPTILEAVRHRRSRTGGWRPPAGDRRHEPIGGAGGPAAAEFHRTQYFEMLGSRSIFHEGWKATTNHISTGVLDEEELAIGSRTSMRTAGSSSTCRRTSPKRWTGPQTSRIDCAS
jgi:hypothetical protein